MDILLDTLLYTPSIEVFEIDKAKGFAKVIDLFNNNAIKTVKLHQCKSDCYRYYFWLGNRTFWLHNLYKNSDRGDNRKSIYETLNDQN